MSLYLDTKYLNLYCNKLEQFKQINTNVYNCRCCICGDSKKDLSKTRMYFFVKGDGIRVYCHNCGYSSSFIYFLKKVDSNLYKQYMFEVLRDKQAIKDVDNDQIINSALNTLRSSKTIATSDSVVDDLLSTAIRVDKLPNDHYCKQYVIGRQIPADKIHLLYYVDDFAKFVNRAVPGKFHLHNKEPRLIIPYFDKTGKCFAFQGRALDRNNPIRYISIKIDQDVPMVYGLDRVDYSKQIYCTEGPIDSLFLPNCIAVSGSSYNDSIVEKLKSNLIIVPDNERRNKQVSKQIGTMIRQDYRVCLWPNNLNFKDINEAIENGWTTDQLVELINSNAVSGLSGLVKYKLWVK